MLCFKAVFQQLMDIYIDRLSVEYCNFPIVFSPTAVLSSFYFKMLSREGQCHYSALTARGPEILRTLSPWAPSGSSVFQFE